MNLHSENPFFILNTPINESYPSLHHSIKTDVLIVGGGITSAILAWELYHAGIEVCVIDKRHVGLGSTAASTGLLQYEIDTPLYKLIDQVGEQNAYLSYLLCREAIYHVQDISSQLKTDNGFKLYPSFQFASKQSDLDLIRKEYHLRNSIGIESEFFDEKEVEEKYGFKKAGGIYSPDGAIINAYKFTRNIFSYLHDKGVSIFDNTEAIDITHTNHQVQITTNHEYKIKTKRMIIACGYESSTFLPKRNEKLLSTYAFISEPLPEDHYWYKDSLIWETKSPYLYIRKFEGNRIIVGGADDMFYNTHKRNKNLPLKTKQNLNHFKKLFPNIPIKVDFSWAGTFASTNDGLPYISTAPYSNRIWFALCFGGNGITFSAIAANIIKDEISGKKNPNKHLFSFDR